MMTWNLYYFWKAHFKLKFPLIWLNDKFWGHTVHTTIHILNRGLLRRKNDKTPYELWTWREANVWHFIIFGSKCYIKREDKKIGKFDSWVDEGIFVGYSFKRKAYKCYNLRLDKVIESINVKIDEGILTSSREDSEESNDEGEEVFDHKEMKKMKME